MQVCIPVRLRGKYFGTRNGLLYLSLVVFMLALSGLLAWLDSALLAFQLLFAGALVLRVVSVLAQSRMQTSTDNRPAVPEPPWPDQLRQVRSDTMFVRFVLFASAMGFASTLFGPFYPVFMLEVLHLTAAHTNLILLTGVLGAAISFPAWGRLLDRFGNVPVMIVSMILWQAFNALYSVVDAGHLWLLYVINPAGGIFSAGYGIGLFGLLLKLSPPGARTMGMAVFVSISSLTAALAPITGGWLLTAAQARGVPALDAFHAAFLVAPGLMIGCCLLLRPVREPNSASVTDVVGAFRNVRTVASLFGLTFLVNQVFYRPGNRPRPPVPPHECCLRAVHFHPDREPARRTDAGVFRLGRGPDAAGRTCVVSGRRQRHQCLEDVAAARSAHHRAGFYRRLHRRRMPPVALPPKIRVPCFSERLRSTRVGIVIRGGSAARNDFLRTRQPA